LTKPLLTGHSAIVLAGGRSRRMGVDKASVRIGGRRLLDRVLSVVTGLFDDVVVVGRAEWTDAPGAVRFAEDDFPGRGPLGGLYTGLGLVAHERALVMGCDMPFITAEALRELVSHDGEADATVARTDGCPQPLLAVYDRRVRPVVGRLFTSDDRSLMNLLSTISVEYVDLADAGACLGVNTPEELREANRRFREEGGT
jgi:molybdopterin-guanine dinucleotide biosynthesis protein A